MRIPRYWAREVAARRIGGKAYRLVAWGHSDASARDAAGQAVLRLEQIVSALSRGRGGDSYDYHTSPIREERIQTIGDEHAPEAIITRNGYGSRVLNTKRVMFVDIDLPPARPLLRWFQGREADVRKAIGVVESFVSSQRSSGFRIYETAAGLRLLATDRLHDPCSEQTDRTLAELGADPLYKRLCHRQRCFRARLSAKPWRIGVARAPVRFPEPHNKDAHARWCVDYEKLAREFQVCRYLRTLGADNRVPEIERVVRVHDEQTRALWRGSLA